MKFSTILLPVFLVILLGSCKKDPPAPKPVPPAPQPDTKSSSMVFKFVPEVTGQGTISSDSVMYNNTQGDKFSVSKFNYYISNITLLRKDSTSFTEPESYHLIRHFEGPESFTISNVPPGDYTTIRFMIGVDSLRNVSGARSGALDVANQMFWDWNTGYIFYKLEGNYVAMSSTEGSYSFHIGGFAGQYKTNEWVELGIEGANVSSTDVPVVTVLSDAAAIFDSPYPMGFDTYSQTAASAKRDKSQSTNYRDMFSLGVIQILKK